MQKLIKHGSVQTPLKRRRSPWTVVVGAVGGVAVDPSGPAGVSLGTAGAAGVAGVVGVAGDGIGTPTAARTTTYGQ